MKHCPRCSKNLPEENFSKGQRYCKFCKAEYVKENRLSINFTARLRYDTIKRNRIKEYLTYEKDHIGRIKFRRSLLYKSIRDMGFCFKCGTTSDLCVHHIDKNPINNDLGNIQILCRFHHSLLHSKQKRIYP